MAGLCSNCPVRASSPVDWRVRDGRSVADGPRPARAPLATSGPTRAQTGLRQIRLVSALFHLRSTAVGHLLATPTSHGYLHPSLVSGVHYHRVRQDHHRRRVLRCRRDAHAAAGPRAPVRHHRVLPSPAGAAPARCARPAAAAAAGPADGRPRPSLAGRCCCAVGASRCGVAPCCCCCCCRRSRRDCSIARCGSPPPWACAGACFVRPWRKACVPSNGAIKR